MSAEIIKDSMDELEKSVKKRRSRQPKTKIKEQLFSEEVSVSATTPSSGNAIDREGEEQIVLALKQSRAPSYIWKLVEEHCGKAVPGGFDLADMALIWDELAERHKEFAMLAWRYCQDMHLKLGYQRWDGTVRVDWTPPSEQLLELSVTEQILLATLWETALVRPVGLDKSSIFALTHAAAEQFEAIIAKLYRDDVLSPYNLPILPRRHRFFHGVYLAFEMLNDQEFQNGQALLSFCLSWYPSMEHAVQIIMEELGDAPRIQQERLAKTEFDMYSMTIKESLDFLINTGRFDEAEHLLASYEELNPSDPEILEYRRDLGLNQNMRPLN